MGRPSASPRKGLNSIATMAAPRPSAASRAMIRRSPTGEAITVHIAVALSLVVVVTLCLLVGGRWCLVRQLVERGPEVQQGVGPPRPPAQAAVGHVVDAEPV